MHFIFHLNEFVVIDNKSKFNNKSWCFIILCSNCNVWHTSPFHPRTNHCWSLGYAIVICLCYITNPYLLTAQVHYISLSTYWIIMVVYALFILVFHYQVQSQVVSNLRSSYCLLIKFYVVYIHHSNVQCWCTNLISN